MNDTVPSLEAIEARRTEWGNMDWTAPAGFIRTMLEECEAVPEDGFVLECGSGLTTTYLEHSGVRGRYLSLEQDRGWTMDLQEREPGVNVQWAPLRQRASYDWYDLRPLRCERVDLLVVDGPRGDTRGGRRGAWPEVHGLLAPRWTILLDDAHRPAEQALFRGAWPLPRGTSIEVHAHVDSRAWAVIRSPR